MSTLCGRRWGSLTIRDETISIVEAKRELYVLLLNNGMVRAVCRLVGIICEGPDKGEKVKEGKGVTYGCYILYFPARNLTGPILVFLFDSDNGGIHDRA
jgi:hypothetical protein